MARKKYQEIQEVQNRIKKNRELQHSIKFRKDKILGHLLYYYTMTTVIEVDLELYVIILEETKQGSNK